MSVPSMFSSYQSEIDPNNSELTERNQLITKDNRSLYPYRARWTPFIMKSINNNKFDCLHLKNIDVSNNNINYNNINNFNNHLPVIIGGYLESNTKFISMKCNLLKTDTKTDTKTDAKENSDDSFNFDLKSLNLDYNTHISGNNDTINDEKENLINELKNNTLNNVGISRPDCCLTYFIENDNKYGNCLIVIKNTDIGYNIYSIDKDEWLLENKNKLFANVFKNRFDAGTGARGLLFNQSYVTYIYIYIL